MDWTYAGTHLGGMRYSISRQKSSSSSSAVQDAVIWLRETIAGETTICKVLPYSAPRAVTSDTSKKRKGRNEMSRAGCSKTSKNDEEVLSTVRPLSKWTSFRSNSPLQSNEPTKKTPSVKWKFRHSSPYVCTRLSDVEVLSFVAPVSKGWYRSRLFVEPKEQKRKQKSSSKSPLQRTDSRAGKKVVNV